MELGILVQNPGVSLALIPYPLVLLFHLNLPVIPRSKDVCKQPHPSIHIHTTPPLNLG